MAEPVEWNDQDSKLAQAQGWALYPVWDPGKRREEWVVFADTPSKIFLTEEAARAFVAERAKKGDALATKAIGISFRSKVGEFPKKSKTKERA